LANASEPAALSAYLTGADAHFINQADVPLMAQ
jgi:hypothetical protein